MVETKKTWEFLGEKSHFTHIGLAQDKAFILNYRNKL